MERYILKDNEARSRYEFDLGGHTAYIDYEKDNGTIVLTHTFVPEAYEGRGVGAQLVAAALTDIRRQGLKVVPQCSFVAVYIKRHPEVERHGERNGRRRTLTGAAASHRRPKIQLLGRIIASPAATSSR